MYTYVLGVNVKKILSWVTKSLEIFGVNQSSWPCFPCDWIICKCATKLRTLNFDEKFAKCHPEKFIYGL